MAEVDPIFRAGKTKGPDPSAFLGVGLRVFSGRECKCDLDGSIESSKLSIGRVGRFGADRRDRVRARSTMSTEFVFVEPKLSMIFLGFFRIF